ncbi:hypothetical protein COU57_06745 [Candidatus Pacearchaeota archaeon CG10_big_fil_rev_8_21_14_0_10_32_14]|nr:MAG: hypothetical protein COU57_06745 [Candidatus Pacearchaeota archaeon CG10_big_fil_rev_8_21_14_0_10_32_14]
MKRVLRVAFLIILITNLLYLVSAEVIIGNVGQLYNLADPVSIPVTIKTSKDVNGFFSMNLLCNGKEAEIYKEYVYLKAGEEKKMASSILLIQSITGVSANNCKLKAVFGDEYAITPDFRVSNKITLSVLPGEETYKPGEGVLIQGDAIKENGDSVVGFVEITSNILNGGPKVITTNSNSTEIVDQVALQGISLKDTVNNGYFGVNFSLPSNTKAGSYQINIRVYEKDPDGIETNSGTGSMKITVQQVPTSLELIINEVEVKPGSSIIARTTLHDQTGDIIPSSTSITLKNARDMIIEVKDSHPTDTGYEYPTVYNEPPGQWKIIASTDKFTSEKSFKIKVNQEITVEIVNKTLLITNVGNVPYNKTITVKIGDKKVLLDLDLDVDEVQKYKMNAPDGEYDVEVIEDGKTKANGRVALTGNVISLKESSSSSASMIKYPLVWMFMILIIGFIAVMAARKGYKQSFIGSQNNKNKKKNYLPISSSIIKKPADLFIFENTAELSLSLKGNKQPAKLVCLKIKNASLAKAAAKEPLHRIIDKLKELKGVVYENGDYYFMIFAPEITKTYKTEMSAINLAKYSKEVIDKYNQLARIKLDYGISVNQGDIVAKKERDPKSMKETLKFMSLGNLLGDSKKLSTVSRAEILLTKEFNVSVSTPSSPIKTEKHNRDNLDFYTFKDSSKGRDGIDNSKQFLNSFTKRNEYRTPQKNSSSYLDRPERKEFGQNQPQSDPKQDQPKKEPPTLNDKFTAKDNDDYFDLSKL